MGALTLKPSAYTFRTWEVFNRPAPDLFDYTAGLIFGVRGSCVVRVAHSAWLRDRVRFCYDGFRRQRLVRPHLRGRQAGWAATMVGWLAHAGRPTVVAGPTGEAHWVCRLATHLGRSGGAPWGWVVDLNRAGHAFWGPFGLAGAAYAETAWPSALDYEAAGLTSPPLGVSTLGVSTTVMVQALSPFWPTPIWGLDALPEGVTCGGGYRQTRSIFQVSPIQRLLVVATD